MARGENKRRESPLYTPHIDINTFEDEAIKQTMNIFDKSFKNVQIILTTTTPKYVQYVSTICTLHYLHYGIISFVNPYVISPSTKKISFTISKTKQT